MNRAQRTARLVPLAWVLTGQLALADPTATPPQATPPQATPPQATPPQVAQAVADAAPADAGAIDSGAFQSVVVTAQKRAEDVKDVPISISVIGGEALEQMHINDYEDLSRAAPGVSFNSQGAASGLNNIIVRGISSTSGSATVGLYLDDVSITVKNFYDGAPQPRLFDLDRIEVLKGPQGTLWGDSSEGGTIRFVSNQPDVNKSSARVTTDGSYTHNASGNYLAAGVLNVPVVPGTFALRGSISYMHDSGYIDRYTQTGQLRQPGIDYEDALMMHFAGKLVVGDDFVVTPSLVVQRDYSNDNHAFYPALGLWKQDKQVQEYGTDELFLPSLTVVKGLGFADFTSVTGLFERQFKRQEDGTYYNSTAFAQFFLDPLYPNQPLNDSVIANLPSAPLSTTRYRNFSQELRLSSSAPEAGALPLKWVSGVYFSNQWIHNQNFQTIPGLNSVFQQIYGYSMNDPAQSLVWQQYSQCVPMSPSCSPVLFPGNIDESDNRYYLERQTAVFGQVDYALLESLHAGLGARYAISAEDFHSNEIGFYQIGNINPYYQSARFKAFTPRASLAYDIDPQSNVYTSASKGFRLGGPTGPITFGPASVCNGDFMAIGQTTQPTKFNSDSLWTYEFGTKNRLAANHFSLDAAAFLTNWKDIQQQIYLPTCGYYFTKNIGNARIYGGELEASARVLRGLTLSATATVQHAAITSTDAPQTAAVGARLIDVPNKTFTGAITFDRPLTDETGFTSRLDYDWTGRSYGTYNFINGATGLPNPNFRNSPYGVMNLTLGITTTRYDVALYAKNAANIHTIIQRPEINTVVEGYTVRPRTLGLTATYRF